MLALAVRHHDSSIARVGGLTLTSRDMPGVAHHQFKVLVVLDGGGHVLVVLFELFNGHNTIFDIGVKGIQKFPQHFDRLRGAFFDVGVPRDVVRRRQIVHGDHPVAGIVQNVKGLVHQCQPSRRHGWGQTLQKFVVTDGTVAIGIKIRHDALDLFVAEINAKITQTVFQFGFGQTLVVGVVHQPQYPGDGLHAIGTRSFDDGLFDFLHNVATRVLVRPSVVLGYDGGTTHVGRCRGGGVGHVARKTGVASSWTAARCPSRSSSWCAGSGRVSCQVPHRQRCFATVHPRQKVRDKTHFAFHVAERDFAHGVKTQAQIIFAPVFVHQTGTMPGHQIQSVAGQMFVHPGDGGHATQV